MGSTNTGRFSDYPKARPQESPSVASGGAGGGGQGSDPCADIFINHELLEEVARSAYFERTGDVPPVGTDVAVQSQLVAGRLAVGVRADGEVIGLLSTRWNQLFACMQAGWRYEGEVVASVRERLPTVRVELRPMQ